MPFYKYEHIPGIDWLGSDMDSNLSVRQLGSVAAQFGKRRVLTESFGCCGWDVTPAELKKIAGFQYVNGVNVMCHHLIPYCSQGQRKYDHPPHFNKNNPWIKEHFTDFNDYLSKLGTLLSKGEEYVDVAILHPIRSAYFDFKRHGEEFGVLELDKQLQRTVRAFSSRGIAYHFLDETLLEEHGFTDGNIIGCGACGYTYLVLPEGIATMGKSTERLLRKYVEAGGKVLIMGQKPSYLEGETYEYTYLKNNCTLEEIMQAQPFQVEDIGTELYCTYRRLDDRPVLVVQNASGDKAFTQTFHFEDGSSQTVTVYQNDTVVLFPTAASQVKEKKLQEYEFAFQKAEVSFDNNFFTMDTVRYSKDGTNYSKPILVKRLFHQLLEERYMGRLWLKYDFQVQIIPKELMILAEKTDSWSYALNGVEIRLEERYENEPSLYMMDVTSLVRIGLNSFEMTLHWHQSEVTYYTLFGENVTESLKNCIVYDTELEPVYLMGKFGVYSAEQFECMDNETVCGHDFYIGSIPNRISEPVLEGLPFMRGHFNLHQKVLFPRKDILLCLAGRYLTAKVWINEQYAGELFFERRLDISAYVIEGENDVVVEFTAGNRNTFGPFHSELIETYVSPAMFTECTLPNYQSGVPRYKFKRFYKEDENQKCYYQ